MSLPNRFTGEDLLITFLPDGETEPVVLSGDLTDFQFSRSTSNVDLTAGSGKDRNFSTTKTQYEFDLTAFVNTTVNVKDGSRGLIGISPSGDTYDKGYYYFTAIINGIEEGAAFDAGYDMNLTGLVTGQIVYWEKDYLVRAEFTVDEASPIATPHVAFPGPGQFTVTMPSKSSVSGGSFAVDAGDAATHALKSVSTYARKAGRTLTWTAKRVTGDTQFGDLLSGFHSGLSWDHGNQISHAVTTRNYITADAVSVVMPPEAQMVLNQNARYWIVLEEPGALYFQANPDTNEPRLLWVDEYSSNTPMGLWMYGALSAVDNVKGRSEFARLIDMPDPFKSTRELAVVNSTTFAQSISSPLSNSGFDVWSGGLPSSWTSVGEAPPDLDVYESAPDGTAGTGAVFMHRASSGNSLRIERSITPSKWYYHEVVRGYVSGANQFLEVGDEAGQQFYATPSTPLAENHLSYNSSGFTRYFIYNTGDVTLDSFKISEITLDPAREAVANGLFEFMFTLPASPVFGDQIELRFREVDERNYLSLMLYRNNGYWGLRLLSYTSGIPTQIVSTTVGDTVGLRAIAHNNKINLYTSANGNTWTRRGSEYTVTAHQTATKIRAVYSPYATPVSIAAWPSNSGRYSILKGI